MGACVLSVLLQRNIINNQFYFVSSQPAVDIVQQFFKHNFPVRHSATTKRNTYRSCLVCDTCIRELIVLDVPLQVRHTLTSQLNGRKYVLITSEQIISDWFRSNAFILMKSPQNTVYKSTLISFFLVFFWKISVDFL